MRPNFFIVGAPKAGTTALYEYLKNHPEIFMSEQKEPHYFAKDIRFRRHVPMDTYEDYMRLFAHANEQHRAIGEASVHYLHSTTAIPNIKETYPDARIIMMLRNPIDIAYSYHRQRVYNFFEDVTDFEEAWRLQSERLAGRNIPPHCDDPALLQYRKISLLGEQAEFLLQHFAREQVHFAVFDDFVSDTATCYRQVLEFLDVNQDYQPKFVKVNASKTHHSKILGKFLSQPPLFVEKLKQCLDIQGTGLGMVIRRLNNKEEERKPLRPVFRQQLVEEFYHDVEKLSQILDRSLDGWHG